MTKFTTKNTNANEVIRVEHAGKNDYRVVVDGTAWYQLQHFGLAVSKANWLAEIDAEFFAEIKGRA